MTSFGTPNSHPAGSQSAASAAAVPSGPGGPVIAAATGGSSTSATPRGLGTRLSAATTDEFISSATPASLRTQPATATGGSSTSATLAGLGAQLITAATRVAAMGCTPTELAALTNTELESYQRTVAELLTHTKTFAALGAGEIARRSTFQDGYTGMARSNGHPTPEAHIQSLTGGKLDDTRELVAVGKMGIAHENAAAAADELGIDLATATTEDITELSHLPAFAELAGPDTIWQAPIIDALTHGHLDASAADAIRKGLGTVDTATTAPQLRDLATQLISTIQTEATHNTPLSPERILKQARLLRASIDTAAIERGAKTRMSQRSFKIWEKDDMLNGHFRVPMEHGGAEIQRYFTETISPRIGGPRFTSPDEKASAQAIIDDPRSNEQILADELVDLIHFPSTSTSTSTDTSTDTGTGTGTGTSKGTGTALAPVTPITPTTRDLGAQPDGRIAHPVATLFDGDTIDTAADVPADTTTAGGTTAGGTTAGGPITNTTTAGVPAGGTTTGDTAPGEIAPLPPAANPTFADGRPRRRSVVAIIVERTTPTTTGTATSTGGSTTTDTTTGTGTATTVTGTATGTGTGTGSDFGTCTTPTTGTPLPVEVAERAICTDDIVEVSVTTHGQILTLGRTRRLFTDAQRLALAIQWGGCAINDCTKPAEFTEAHHIKQWKRDNGASDTSNGICLCRFHHMMIHDAHWDITRDGCLYWLIPPRTIDPTQTPVPLYSNNPAIRAKQERALRDHATVPPRKTLKTQGSATVDTAHDERDSHSLDQLRDRRSQKPATRDPHARQTDRPPAKPATG